MHTIINSLNLIGAKQATIDIVKNLNQSADKKLIVSEWAPEDADFFHEPVKNLKQELKTTVDIFVDISYEKTDDDKKKHLLHHQVVAIQQKYYRILQ